MKKRRIIIAMMIAVMMFTSAFAVSSHVSYTQKFPSVGKTAKIVLIDVNNQNIRPDVIRANEKISSAEAMSSMVARKKAQSPNIIGAINGTYFSAYDGVPLPYGTIIEDGKVVHIGNYGSVMGFTKDNKMIIDNLDIQIKGFINGEERYYAWGLNHPRTEPGAIVIYTNEYNDIVDSSNAKSVVIQNETVTGIVQNNAQLSIPENGMVIAFNPDVQDLVDRFAVGDKIGYELVYTSKNIDQTNPQNVNWKDVEFALGAGPSLVIDGKVTADGSGEGFWEAKINTNRAQRSFVGYTYDNKLVMGTVSSVNLKELAQICVELKLKGAMCMDGGASSGLYYKDKFMTSPGRKLNNILIFTEENK